MPRAPSYTCCARVYSANFVEEVGLMRKSNYAFVISASCFLQRSGPYIALIVEVILKLIIDASSTQ